MNLSQPRRRVGVFPAAELDQHRALFDALEGAYPVSFEPRLDGELRELDAAVQFWGSEQARAAADAGVLALSLLLPEPADDSHASEIRLSKEAAIDSRLRGAVLPDGCLGGVDQASALEPGIQAPPNRRVTVLATGAGKPVWVRSGSLDQALLAPRELGQGEALRERMRDGRCAALLPLVHLLCDLTDGLRWRPPNTRAAFLLDDPNLHWPSYGFIKLPDLVDHAREHSYHLALATIPLDGWFAHPKAVRALADGNGALSLCVHGNDHSGGELGRPATDAEALALAAQALRRVEAFEARTGVRVDRIMAPPHEACSEESVRALLRCGFEAISMTRPYPWEARPPRSWLARPEGADPLVGWRPAEFIAGGLPVLLRHPLKQRSGAEMRLRAFLDHPLILYGHHGDLENGLGLLADAAAEVNALRTTRWCSLGEIAAGSYETRSEGSKVRVRLLSRRARVEIPAGADELAIELSPSHAEPSKERLAVDGNAVPLEGRTAEPISVAPGSTVELELQHADRVDFWNVQAPRRRPLALARRVAGESRDRVQPLLARAR